MKSLNKSLLLVALTTCLFAVSAAPAAANTIYYALTEDHCSLPDGCGGDGHLFGAVQLEDITGGVALTVFLADGSKFVETGFPNGEPTSASIAFNLIGDHALTYTSSQSQLALLSGDAGSLKFSGLGTFEYALDCLICGHGGGEGAFGPLSINLFGLGLDVNDFAELSSNGHPSAYFAVDIFSGISGTSGVVGSTGTFVTVNPLTVPDGGPTMALLGSAMLGLGLLQRKLGQG